MWDDIPVDFAGGSDGKASVYNAGDPLEKEMATHPSTLALKIPWTKDLGAGYCPWGRKESGTTERLHFLSFFFHFTFVMVICDQPSVMLPL